MTSSSRAAHWQAVYESKGEREVSWFQESPSPSLELIALTGAGPTSSIVDIGGGASRLVDALLSAGYANLTVLDLSDAALAASRARLGAASDGVAWIAADVTAWQPTRTYDLWYDRAAFHFLNALEEQAAYVAIVRRAVKIGGHVIIGTFAVDGPEKCSGLPVTRHSADSIAALLGPGFTLTDHRRHQHATPWQSVQNFQFSSFVRTS
ncbi:class I SAM-dependent methyltransferase [Bradyrhizobium daqingense]|uniref:Methyltransferase family protein n=1 Tax=Bradyrhizobium daqingense TaxID=993502 RepID=A0A562KT86_9BRAD|nr:class I SAM-dependent methyltransferase [Bradyrhizobium daqingense]TWH98546.1 methyltransferase family protein [Bradyrhizobium daqingense]UFS92865.1 class I SAM-dependent methyltransferase [Bradyrhizobium daqingense]